MATSVFIVRFSPVIRACTFITQVRLIGPPNSPLWHTSKMSKTIDKVRAARELLLGNSFGVLSTISLDVPGYPFGSVTLP
jgi:hypothetical protein